VAVAALELVLGVGQVAGRVGGHASPERLWTGAGMESSTGADEAHSAHAELVGSHHSMHSYHSRGALEWDHVSAIMVHEDAW